MEFYHRRTKRAKRRHHQQRMIQKYINNELHYGWYIWMYDEEERMVKIKEMARLNSNHAKVCSCWMCCNEIGISKQEYDSLWLEAEGKEEMGLPYERPRRKFEK